MVKLSDVESLNPGSCCINTSPCRHPDVIIRLHNGKSRMVYLRGSAIESLALFLPSQAFQGDASHFSGQFRSLAGRQVTRHDALDTLQAIFPEPERPTDVYHANGEHFSSLLVNVHLEEVIHDRTDDSGEPRPPCCPRVANCWNSCLGCLRDFFFCQNR